MFGSNTIGTGLKSLCMISVFLMVAISVVIYKAPAMELIIYAAFFVLYIQMPGIMLLKWCGIDNVHTSTTLALGMFAGWAFNILIYFINDLIGNNILLTTAGPILSVFYFYSIVKDSREEKINRKRIRVDKLSLAFCVFLVLILLYCLLETQYVYLYPSVSDFTYMNPDKAYHIGLINSLSHDYPLQSPWISGVYIYYHVFSEMMLSIPVRLFGVQADVATQSFGPFLTAYCFGVSYYSFFREMSTNPKRAGAYCLIVLLSNIYVTRKISVSIAYKFILANDNSSGYGMAAALMSIVAFKKWYESFVKKEGKQHKLLILCAAVVMLTTGIKGPMGAVTVAGLWGAIILGIALRKVMPKTLPALLLITAGFMLVYMTVLGSKGQANASGYSIIAFGKIMNIAFWKEPVFEALMSLGIPKIIVIGIEIVIFMVFFLSAFFLPFCIGYMREFILVISGREEYDVVRVFVYAECAVGIVAMFFLRYSGHSQIYFGIVSAFLAPMIAFWFLEEMERKRDRSHIATHTLRVCVSVMAATLVFTTCTFTSYLNRHVTNAIANANPHKEEPKYLSVSKDEFDAMEWIEINTEKDSLIAVDRYFSVDPQKYSYENRWDNRFFLYGVYSNRFTYIEGSGYNIRQADWHKRKEMIETNRKMYDQRNAGRGDLARELGVDYVVVSKRINGEIDLANDDFELCFTNNDVDIYKIDQ